MTSNQQRAELHRRIWQIANDVRGAVDGWDFKQYVLGSLFYRFISENFADYIEGGDDSVKYAELADNVITPAIKDDAIKTKGYFIYPSQLFANVAANANNNESLNTELAAIFLAIESSANGYPSERDIKGLFVDFDTTSNRLGNTVVDKNTRLAAVLKGVAGLDFSDFDGSRIDLFGDAYEFLISNYAANAGKSGGEFFTPQHVSKLIAQLAMHKQTSVNKIYDPACGSGSLLLQAKKHIDAHAIEDGFFGQELNHTTYNLARMNMFLHNINYDKFNIQLGDTLRNPYFGDEKPFDAIVSNPPYSVKWIGSDDPTLINDDRFAPAGVLAPKSKADFAFVLHALSYLSSKGRAAIVCFPGIFYRSGAEQKIRKYPSVWLLDNQGRVYSWGYNQYGQLGNGNSTNQNAPKLIPLSVTTPIKDIYVTGGIYAASFLIGTNGILYAAGETNSSLLTSNSSTHQPVMPWGWNKTVKKIFSCETPGTWDGAGTYRRYGAVLDNGELWMWGDQGGYVGDVGDTTNRYSVNTMLTGNRLVTDICALGTSSQQGIALLLDDGQVWQTGYAGGSQLPENDSESTWTPMPVVF